MKEKTNFWKIGTEVKPFIYSDYLEVYYRLFKMKSINRASTSPTGSEGRYIINRFIVFATFLLHLAISRAEV